MARAAWIGWVLGVLVSTSGCIAGEPVGEPADVIVVDRTALAEVTPGEHLLLDLRDARAVYVFDPADGYMDLGRVWLICPDGSHMGLPQWLAQREAELGQDPRGDSLWALGLDRLAMRQALADQVSRCPTDCHLCPDGAWICGMQCTTLGGRDRGDRTESLSHWMYEFRRRNGREEEQPFLDGPWPRPDEGGAFGGATPSGDGSGFDGSGSSGSGAGWGPAGQPPPE